MPGLEGIFFKLARCGYTLRVTSKASYSHEYITPTQKKLYCIINLIDLTPWPDFEGRCGKMGHLPRDFLHLP
jgi:hypothetical protein